MAIESLHIL